MTDKQLRELDAWIAEHVMGWKRVEKFVDLSSSHFNVRDDGEVLAYGWPENLGITFAPTTDPAAAMAVLEKCAEKAYACIQKTRPGDSTLDRVHGHYNVRKLDRTGMWEPGIIANAKTLPLAICLFAKKVFAR